MCFCVDEIVDDEESGRWFVVDGQRSRVECRWSKEKVRFGSKDVAVELGERAHCRVAEGLGRGQGATGPNF